MAADPLYTLFRSCIVRIRVSGDRGEGTGFFVAPGLILTCAHVIEMANQVAAHITWCVEPGDASVDQPITEVVAYLPRPYPDLALLRVNQADHACVYLDPTIRLSEKLYAYGFTAAHPFGDSITVDYEGPIGGERVMFKLKQGQVPPGASGAPLL